MKYENEVMRHDADKGKPKQLEKDQSHCYLIHHKTLSDVGGKCVRNSVWL
jgi:hypothetical protein